MDGLLINTEDIYTLCHNILLAEYNAGPMTWDIKSQLQGRPAAQAIELLLAFFKLDHVDPTEYATKLHVIQEQEFKKAAPLPGVEKLLKDLKERGVHIALATSSRVGPFKIKTDHLSPMFDDFVLERRVLGDDTRIPQGRGKPSPDIFQVALKTINDTLADGEVNVKPEESLVFEDSVPGIIAGRRAGMRVVWVPHEGLAQQYNGREAEVLAGRGEGSHIDPHELGELGDGWGQQLVSLAGFPYEKYGIVKSA